MGVVYLVENTVTGKQYIGKTIGELKYRRKMHEKDAFNGSKGLFHRAIHKYGVAAFRWSILLRDDRPHILVRLERHYIKKLETKKPNGYNLTDGGEGMLGWIPSEECLEKRRNKIMSEEAKRKISEATKKQWQETNLRYIVSHARKGKRGVKGRPRSQEYREKIRQKLMGHKVSSVTRRKISKKVKEWYKSHPDSIIRWNKGKRMSPEFGEKLSIALKGRPKPPGFGDRIKRDWHKYHKKKNHAEMSMRETSGPIH